jgi:hypothetical protein
MPPNSASCAICTPTAHPAPDDFAPPRHQAARAKALGDTGESGPENWEPPLGTPDVHVVVVALAPNSAQLDAAVDRVRPRIALCPA